MCVCVIICSFSLLLHPSIFHLPALRNVSILDGRSLSFFYTYNIYKYCLSLFLELINSVLKSLSEDMYRVIGDQPICSSNLCWARRIYTIDCASFVLSVLSIIMNVAEDRCVSVWGHGCFVFHVGGPVGSGACVVLQTAEVSACSLASVARSARQSTLESAVLTADEIRDEGPRW